MQVKSTESVPSQKVVMPGASGCTVRWLVSDEDGAPNFAMREFEVAVGGYTPRHSHPYEHEVYVLAGEGVVYRGDEAHPIKSGDAVYVESDEVHQFKNVGSAPMRFLCMVPNSVRTLPVTAAPECEQVER
jgi:quercetin dioxygenase-like cupin family protein